jgi:hypothetical protein
VNIFSQRLANPRDWALAARAYISLSVEWQRHARTTRKSRFNDIINVGTGITRGLRRISTSRQLFQALRKHYTAQLAQLRETVTTRVEQKFLDGEDPFLRGKRISAQALWSGSNQALAASEQIGLQNYERCAEDDDQPPSTIAARGAVPSQLIPAAVMKAWYLGLARVHVCWEARWLGQSTIALDIVSWFTTNLASERWARATWSRARLQRYVVSSRQCAGQTCFPAELMAPGAWADAPARDTETPTTASDTNFVGQTPELVDAWLNTARATLLTNVRDSFESDAAVRLAAERLGGARRTVEAFVLLGYPRALGADIVFRSLVTGEGALFGQREIRAQLTRSGAPTSLAQLWESIDQAAGARWDALQAKLNHYRSLILNGRYREAHRLIVVTINQLKIAREVVFAP